MSLLEVQVFLGLSFVSAECINTALFWGLLLHQSMPRKMLPTRTLHVMLVTWILKQGLKGTFPASHYISSCKDFNIPQVIILFMLLLHLNYEWTWSEQNLLRQWRHGRGWFSQAHSRQDQRVLGYCFGKGQGDSTHLITVAWLKLGVGGEGKEERDVCGFQQESC